MLYAILAYHVESDVTSMSAEEDAALMANLRKAHERLDQVGRLGPAARLGETVKARTLRGPGEVPAVAERILRLRPDAVVVVRREDVAAVRRAVGPDLASRVYGL